MIPIFLGSLERSRFLRIPSLLLIFLPTMSRILDELDLLFSSVSLEDKEICDSLSCFLLFSLGCSSVIFDFFSEISQRFPVP